jgi:hypothetical protein
MPFRERMKYRSDLGHAILVVACVAAFFGGTAPRSYMVWVMALGTGGIIIARVLSAGRCPSPLQGLHDIGMIQAQSNADVRCMKARGSTKHRDDPRGQAVATWLLFKLHLMA